MILKFCKNLGIGLSLLFVFFSSAHPREITDVTQTQVILSNQPQRIVTLAPSLGELVADLLGEDLSRLKGVTDHTEYPPALKKFPAIGPYHHFNLEKVLELKPDLVIATMDGNSKDQVLHLRELKIPVLTVRTENFMQIRQSISLVSEAMGSAQKGALLNTELEKGLKRIWDQALKRKRPSASVLIQLGDQPLVTVGGRSFLNEALEKVGAKNIYSDATIAYPRPSLEDVLKRDPDVIIIATLGEDGRIFSQMAKRWLQFPKMKAVKNRQVKILKSDALLRPSIRILEGLRQLSQAIYGEN